MQSRLQGSTYTPQRRGDEIILTNEEVFTITNTGYLPGFAQFETNTQCRAACKMCPHSKMTPRREMTTREIYELIDEVVPHVAEICPFLMQEPTREPRLANILGYIKQVNPMCRTIIYSNMGNWTHELTDRILEDGTLDELHISYYAPTREQYKIWQPGLDYDKTAENITYFLEQNNGDINVAFHYLAITDLIGEDGAYVKQFIDKWGKYAPVHLIHYDTFHGDMPEYGDNVKHFGAPASKRTPCPRLWTGLNIHSNGNVVPCCIDWSEEIVLGNIHEDSIHDIWRGEKFEKLRQLHLEERYDEIPLCRNCTLWEHQHGEEWNGIFK